MEREAGFGGIVVNRPMGGAQAAEIGEEAVVVIDGGEEDGAELGGKVLWQVEVDGVGGCEGGEFVECGGVVERAVWESDEGAVELAGEVVEFAGAGERREWGQGMVKEALEAEV